MIGIYTQQITLSTKRIYIEVLVSENNIEQLTLPEYQHSGKGRIRFRKLPLIRITSTTDPHENHISDEADAFQRRLYTRALSRASIDCVGWVRLNLKMQWLDQESRHLVWMRGDRRSWQEICCRFGCNRSTAWRRWKNALQHVADQLTDHCK